MLDEKTHTALLLDQYLSSFETAKDHIRICVIEDENSLPPETLCRPYDDIGLTEYLRVFADSDNLSVSTCVTKEIFIAWNVPIEMLYRAAQKNTAKAAVLTPMSAMFRTHGVRPDIADKIFALTTNLAHGVYGAGAVMLPKELNPLNQLHHPMGLIPANRDAWLCFPQENFHPYNLLQMNHECNQMLLHDPNTREQYLCEGVFAYEPDEQTPFGKVLIS